jgi:radical SAM protein (TIGR01212 family)
MADWPVEKQIAAHIRRHPGTKFIAYFQSHCNTYGSVPELRRKYEIVFAYNEIVGLFIGTRPDAVPEPVLSLLEEMNRRIYLSVELGLQSVHAKSLALLNRNHSYEQFAKTYAALRARNIAVVVHLIIGIPGETLEHMRATIAAMNALKPAGVKFHLLHVLRDTELQAWHSRSLVPLLSLDEYTDIISDLLERLDPAIVVHRLTADREKELFIAPLWALNKAAVLRAIREKMKLRGTFQGRLHGGDCPAARRHVDNNNQMM